MAVSRRDFIKTGVGSACTLAAGATAMASAEAAARSAPASAALADRMPEIPADKLTPSRRKPRTNSPRNEDTGIWSVCSSAAQP